MNFHRLSTLTCATVPPRWPARCPWPRRRKPPGPTKPIRLRRAVRAGGANDLLARAAAEGASKAARPAVVIDNKPGAGAIAGRRRGRQGGARRLHLPDQRGRRDLQQHDQEDHALQGRRPGAGGDDRPGALGDRGAANAPYKDLKDFVAASKKGGRACTSATAGTGSTPHFVEGMLNVKYGAKLDLVPYKSGGESITAVLGGQVEATSEASIVVLPYLKAAS
jgi:hypothetical protein